MSRTTHRHSGHRHSREFLHDIVVAVVPAESSGAYMPFARDLYATINRPPVPDFSRRTKLVVHKYFMRGLSGHLMWLIGERLLGRVYPPAGHGISRN